MTLTMTQTRPGIDEVLKLDSLCLREPGGEPLDMKAHRGKLEQSIPRSEWGSVYRGGQLVAYVYLWPLESFEWFVGGLLIHPRYRNAPTVTALSRTIFDLLKRIDVHRLKSHVLRSNAASLQLHKRLGFEIEMESEIAIAFTADCAPLLRRLEALLSVSVTKELSGFTDERGNV